MEIFECTDVINQAKLPFLTMEAVWASGLVAEGFRGHTEPARSLGAARQVRTWRGYLHPPSRAASASPVPVGTWPTQGVKLSRVGMATPKQRLSGRDPVQVWGSQPLKAPWRPPPLGPCRDRSAGTRRRPQEAGLLGRAGRADWGKGAGRHPSSL